MCPRAGDEDRGDWEHVSFRVNTNPELERKLAKQVSSVI